MTRLRQVAVMGLLGLLLGACAGQSTGIRRVAPQSLLRTGAEVDEALLLDVWIEVFEPVQGRQDGAESVGDAIHKAEARFIPVHLRNTMQATGFWAAVRIVPRGTVGAEVLVGGTLKRSDGRVLSVRIVARDALGEQWFAQTYSGQAVPADYDRLERGEYDAFQDVYNRIANDLARALQKLSANDVRQIRDAAALRFAAELAPTPYDGYLTRDRRGRVKVERLPAEDDPLYARVLALKDRDDMLADTLNAHYDQFYNDMWESYASWRQFSLTEILALEKVRREANTKKLLGAAAILGAIAIEAFGSKNTRARTGTLQTVMVAGGAMAIKAGIDQGAEADIHESAIRELGQSFETEISPMVVEVDGQTIELTGSADAQYTRWRQLLHRRYVAETGVGTIPAAAAPDNDMPAEPL